MTEDEAIECELAEAGLVPVCTHDEANEAGIFLLYVLKAEPA